MATLIYATTVSLDGYIEDAHGAFDWAPRDDDARACEGGLVDECQLFVWPMILGGGKPALPAGVRTDLELLDEHRFGNGVVHLRYRVST